MADPSLSVNIHVDVLGTADGELLENVIHVSGRPREGIEPFETRLRVEFHDEAARTWGFVNVASSSGNAWRQPSFEWG